MTFLRDRAAFTVAVEVAAVSDGGTGGCEHGASSILLGARLDAARVTGAILRSKVRIVLRVEGEGGGGQSASPVSFVRALKFDLSATGPNARGTA